MAFPTIRGPYRIEGTLFKQQYKSKYETGRIYSFPLQSSAKNKITVYYKLPKSELDLLMSAYDSDLGSSFSWTYNSETYTMTYGENGVKWSHNISNSGVGSEKYYEVQIDFEQV